MWPEVRATLRVPLSLSWVLNQSEMSALLDPETGSWGGKVAAGGPFTTPWAVTEACRGWEVSSVKEAGHVGPGHPGGRRWALSHGIAVP